jgi:hypothetical protein
VLEQKSPHEHSQHRGRVGLNGCPLGDASLHIGIAISASRCSSLNFIISADLSLFSVMVLFFPA